MIIPEETFWTLLHDSAHWEFELFVGFVEMLIFDVIVGLLIWPFLRKHWTHHLERDEREAAKPVTMANTVLGAYGIREEDVMQWTLTNETLTVVFRSK